MQQILVLGSAGYLALPEELRARHRLHEGSRLRVAEEADRIVLEPIEEPSVLLECDGLLLINAKLEGASVDHGQIREERLARLGAVRD